MPIAIDPWNLYDTYLDIPKNWVGENSLFIPVIIVPFISRRKRHDKKGISGRIIHEIVVHYYIIGRYILKADAIHYITFDVIIMDSIV